MLWVYDHYKYKYKYLYSYSVGIDFTDVYRRQILTFKVNPRAVRVNPNYTIQEKMWNSYPQVLHHYQSNHLHMTSVSPSCASPLLSSSHREQSQHVVFLSVTALMKHKYGRSRFTNNDVNLN